MKCRILGNPTELEINEFLASIEDYDVKFITQTECASGTRHGLTVCIWYDEKSESTD